MKRILLCLLLVLAGTAANAQYKNFSFDKGEADNIQLVQIDTIGGSVIAYFTVTAAKDDVGFSMDDDTYVSVEGSYRKYKMLRAINLPLNSENAFCVLHKAGETLNFALQFELFPIDRPFNIIEKDGTKGCLNFKNVCINAEDNAEYMDADAFFDMTLCPVKGYYQKDGHHYAFWAYKGITVTANFIREDAYGKILKIYFDIENFSGRKINVDTDKISVLCSRKENGECNIEEKIISISNYDKKVVNAQSWSQPYTPKKAIAGEVSSAKIRTDNEIAKLGLGILETIIRIDDQQDLKGFYEQQARERDEEWDNYLKSNTLEDGEGLSGFVPIMRKNYKRCRASIIIGDFDFYFYVNI